MPCLSHFWGSFESRLSHSGVWPQGHFNSLNVITKEEARPLVHRSVKTRTRGENLDMSGTLLQKLKALQRSVCVCGERESLCVKRHLSEETPFSTPELQSKSLLEVPLATSLASKSPPSPDGHIIAQPTLKHLQTMIDICTACWRKGFAALHSMGLASFVLSNRDAKGVAFVTDILDWYHPCRRRLS